MGQFMKNVNLSYGLIYLLFTISINALEAKVINERSTYEKLEVINDIKFIFSQKIINGVIDNKYFLENNNEIKPLTKNEYDKLKRDARVQELELQDKLLEENNVRMQKFNHEANIKILKKLISAKLNEIKALILKIKKNNLSLYYIFNENSFSSLENFEVLEYEIIPEFEKLLEVPDSESQISILNSSLEKLETYPAKLNKFFQDIVNNAIKLCDDVKLLRNLIEL